MIWEVMGATSMERRNGLSEPLTIVLQGVSILVNSLTGVSGYTTGRAARVELPALLLAASGAEGTKAEVTRLTR